MIFNETKLKGVYLIQPEKKVDNRGFFSRVWDKEAFVKLGLNSKIEQCNVSFNKTKGTIRGLHFQAKPFEETKIVRCTRGSVFEVIVDIRKNSSTYRKWLGIKLNSFEHNILYIPEGFALGFQTLEDDTELFYQMSQIYNPEYVRGIRWDDKILDIKWPETLTEISERDRNLPYLS